MMLFILLSVLILVLSAVCSWTGVSAVNPANGETVVATNLLSAYGLRYLLTNVVTNFATFAPLALVLVAMIGATVAEKSGLLAAIIMNSFVKMKGWMVTAIIIFVGLNFNIAGDAGLVIVPPLAAVLYMSIGRRPVLGLYIAFGSVAAGFSSSVLLSSIDALLYGITEDASHIIDPSYSSSIACNYYFMAVSTILLTAGLTVVVEKLLIRRFPVTEAQLAKYARMTAETVASVDADAKKKALRKAGISLLILAVILLVLCFPFGGHPSLLAGSKGGLIDVDAPFNKGLVFLIMLAMLVPGIVFGCSVGKYKKAFDVRKDIEAGFAEMGGYVFICFVISIFVNFFAESKLGIIFAINGAEWLRNIGFDGLPLLLSILLLSAFLNLFMGSATAKWAVLAQVFIPMLMLMGYNPALTQLLYRIGDSVSNPISPLFPYVPILLGTINKYYKDAGIGTIISNMLPISLTFFLIWILQFSIWYFLNLPLGPSATIH